MNYLTSSHKNSTIFFLLLLCWIPMISSSQTISSGNQLGGGWTQWPPEVHVEGSRYLYDEFVMGEVFDKKMNIRQAPLRLNLHNDELQYVEDSTIFAFAKPSSIEKIFLGNEVFIYIKPSSEVEVSGFLKKWNSTYPAILTKMKISFYKESTEFLGRIKPNRFVRDPDLHYIMKSGTEIIEITSVKDLIKALGSHSKELYEFAKAERISKNNGAELAKLVDYYHSLNDYL